MTYTTEKEKDVKLAKDWLKVVIIITAVFSVCCFLISLEDLFKGEYIFILLAIICIVNLVMYIKTYRKLDNLEKPNLSAYYMTFITVALITMAIVFIYMVAIVDIPYNNFVYTHFTVTSIIINTIYKIHFSTILCVYIISFLKIRNLDDYFDSMNQLSIEKEESSLNK